MKCNKCGNEMYPVTESSCWCDDYVVDDADLMPTEEESELTKLRQSVWKKLFRKDGVEFDDISVSSMFSYLTIEQLQEIDKEFKGE